MKNEARTNVVIVGGGGAGISAARLLSKSLDGSNYNLILIDPRPHWVFYPATARLLVSDADDLEHRIFFPLNEVFANIKGTFVQAKVVSIEKQTGSTGGKLELSNGEALAFDVLILASGSKWDGPLAFPDEENLTAFISESREAFKAANDIVLVGGGAVGIEFAGEIKDIYPNKNVTIVQGDSLLMNKTYPDKFRKALETRLQARGVNLVFKDYVDNFPQEGAQEVVTRGGKRLKADLVLSTRGPKPNTDFIASSLGQETLSKYGLVKVKKTLQLQRHNEIFAIGDIIDVPEEKQLGKAAGHVEVVSANVLLLLRGQAPTKEYKGSTEMILVTIGKNGGAGYIDALWGIVLGNWLARTLKSKTLMVDYARKSVGLKP